MIICDVTLLHGDGILKTYCDAPCLDDEDTWKGSPIVWKRLPGVAAILIVMLLLESYYDYVATNDDDIGDHLLVGAVARVVAGVVVLGVATALREGF